MGKRTRRLVLAVVAVLVLAFVTWLAVGRGQPAVSSKLIGFSVIDPTMTHVDFQIIKDPDQTGACALKAMNSAYAVVGWKVVTVGPGRQVGTVSTVRQTDRTTAVRADVRTDSLAVTGVVESCWLVPEK